MSPLAQTLAWTLAPTWFMEGCMARLGEMFTIAFFPSGRRFVVLADPAAVKQIFTAPPELAPSAARDSPVRPVVGENSVLVTVGPEHMRQRKLLLGPFHGERMREYEQTIVAATRAEMAGWPRGQAMRVAPRSRAITLEVILTAVFGVSDSRREALRGAIRELLAPVNMLAGLRMALRRPSGERPQGRIGASLGKLDRVLYEEIAARRAGGQPVGNDILSLLLAARDEQGEPMGDEELRDELVTLLLAGHETTATSVAWAMERLARHPEKLARLQAEIQAGGEEYLGAVVNETLRVRPVVPVVARALQAEMTVGGRSLPAGTVVAPSIYLTNRNPRVYERRAEFMPERFLDEAPDTFAWIPFGGGIRRCIGAAFAQLEMRTILRTVLSELTPRPAGRLTRGGEPVRRRGVTLVPWSGARVIFASRK